MNKVNRITKETNYYKRGVKMDGNVYAEVIEVLDNMNIEDRNKIPKNVYDFFREKSSKDYIKHLNKNVALCKQEISEDTKEILAILLINYWCKTENEKNDLLKLFRDNELKYQEELREKYNPYNIFKKHDQENVIEEKIENNTSLVEYKESIFKKLINKIKNIFHI